MNKILFTYRNRIDRATVDAGAEFKIDVTPGWTDGVDYELDINSLDPDVIEAFKVVMDACSWVVEEDAFIWKIEKTAKTFNLESSYMRDVESTGGSLTAIADATPLVVVVEVPGFATARTAELSLWYNEPFDSGELDTIRDTLNVLITGDGAEFTIDNEIDCKIYFKKPTGVTDVYVIDNPYHDEIIEI